MDLPPVALHASTQAENSNIDRIKFLASAGFKRIVLARELSLEQVRAIRQGVSCELEFFIHGALCVSFSGNCYMSAAAGGRSANRGECAQPCRKEWNLTTESGDIISHGHLLSTKDLNHSSNIPELVDAGIDSFKIEGRLKDIHYVKNITAHYRQTIDRILEERPGITKSSSGRTFFDFSPDPERTFNRGYTEYFLHGRKGPVSSFKTPKFTGKKTATVTGINGNSFTVKSDEPLHNGDGLTFTDSEGKLRGIRVNRVEANRVFPLEMNQVRAGTILYRNHDAMFERALDASRTARKIEVDMELSVTGNTATLALKDEDGLQVKMDSAVSGERTESATDPEAGIMRHLKKLGATMFIPRAVTISGADNMYIAPSILNDLRRRACDALEQKRIDEYRRTLIQLEKTDHPYPAEELDFTFNVSNRLARQFYERHGVKTIQPAFELNPCHGNVPVMKTKLCIKYESGICPVYNGAGSIKDPLFINSGPDTYRLVFDCRECIMYVYTVDKK
jgi:putative protease